MRGIVNHDVKPIGSTIVSHLREKTRVGLASFKYLNSFLALEFNGEADIDPGYLAAREVISPKLE